MPNTGIGIGMGFSPQDPKRLCGAREKEVVDVSHSRPIHPRPFVSHVHIRKCGFWEFGWVIHQTDFLQYIKIGVIWLLLKAAFSNLIANPDYP